MSLNKEELFQYIIKKNIHELELECLCIIDLYNKYKTLKTNIDCGIVTPKMMLTEFYDSFKDILLIEVQTILSKKGFNFKVELGTPYSFKGRMIIPLTILDEEESLKVNNKLNQLSKTKKHYCKYLEEVYYSNYYLDNGLCVVYDFKKPVNLSDKLNEYINNCEEEEEENKKKKWVFWS